VTSFAAATFASSPSATVAKGGAGLTACNYDSAKSFAQQLLQYLESMELIGKVIGSVPSIHYATF
jgi:hypothetical protein